jgi:hypothetical protein
MQVLYLVAMCLFVSLKLSHVSYKDCALDPIKCDEHRIAGGHLLLQVAYRYRAETIHWKSLLEVAWKD